MYYIQRDLYNLKEKRIPSLKYNEDDFFKWLINIAWQDEERTESDMWNMSDSSIQPIYNLIQMLMHIYKLNLEEFERIIQSIDDTKIDELEKKYAKEYDRAQNNNIHIFTFEIFSNIKFLFEYFIEQYKKGKILKLIICKDCGEVFVEKEQYWINKGLSIPKRCTTCREKRKLTGKICTNCGKPISKYDENNSYYTGLCAECSLNELLVKK